MSTIDTIRSQSRTPQLRRAPIWKAAWLAVRLVAWFEDKAQKRRSRRALLEMTDEHLKDVGISRADAYREGMRPFWD